MHSIIEIVNGVARNPVYRMKEPVNLTINDGECIAVVGDNGAGKSMLIDVITGKHPLLMNDVRFDFSPSESKRPSDNIKHITFHDTFESDDGTYYYQQRWNQHDIGNYPTVRELLDQAEKVSLSWIEKDASLDEKSKLQAFRDRDDVKKKLFVLFHLDKLLDKKIILLSSGELRKFQITRTLLSNPRVLILDNPFIGLDVNAREQLRVLLKTLVNDTDILLVFVLSKVDDMPDFVTHVVEVENMVVKPKRTLEQWQASFKPWSEKVIDEQTENNILTLPYSDNNITDVPDDFHVIDFNNVCIQYGERTILKDLTFSVMNGERWALSGENGSGKSTLLSIVCADNPQAYANNIILFGRKRGTGESIWDIKKYIGYVSPEMHRAYLRNLQAREIVATGLRDSVGLYLKSKPEQMKTVMFWMDVFGISKYADTSFLNLSMGEQRLVLLARAFVKDPALLILDEPLHGLDLRNRRLVKDIIETFCRRKNKTLIMVTHYEDELPAIIDHKIHLVKQG